MVNFGIDYPLLAAAGSSGEVTLTSGGNDSNQEIAVLASVWNISPKDITICTDAAGNDLVLGTGSFGKVVPLAPPLPLSFDVHIRDTE